MRQSNVGKFTYVVPPLTVDPSSLLCINMVLPIGWVKSPNFFYDASERVAYNENVYALDPGSTFVAYPPKYGAYKNNNGATASLNRLQYVDAYMDDLICAHQGDPNQQQRVSKLTIRSINKIFPSLLGEAKDYTSLNKAWYGSRDWETIKEILG